MMRHLLRHAAAVTAGVLSAGVMLAAPGHAIDDCGVGMYFNNANGQCEPWAPVGVGFAPAVEVPVPVVDPVPLGIGFDPVPIGIGFDPGFGLNVPNIAPYLRVPGIGVPGIPGVRLPGVPDVRVPDVGVPGVRVPDVRVPDVRVPDVRVPDVRVPEVHRR